MDSQLSLPILEVSPVSDGKTPSSGKKSKTTTKFDTPLRKKIDNLEDALERIEELEKEVLKLHKRKDAQTLKHKQKIHNLNSEWNNRLQKLECKKAELAGRLRQKTDDRKKEKAEFQEVLAILDKTITQEPKK